LLSKIFSSLSEMLQSKLVLDDDKMKRGFGFVTFESTSEAAQAMENLNKTFFLGRVLRIEFRSGISKRPNTPPDMQTDTPVATSGIFISNVPPSATNENLINLFSPFGVIQSIRLPIEPISKNNKGYAFIVYDNCASAASAILSINRTIFMNRTLTVTTQRKAGRNVPASTFLSSKIIEHTVNDLKETKKNAPAEDERECDLAGSLSPSTSPNSSELRDVNGLANSVSFAPSLTSNNAKPTVPPQSLQSARLLQSQSDKGKHALRQEELKEKIKTQEAETNLQRLQSELIALKHDLSKSKDEAMLAQSQLDVVNEQSRKHINSEKTLAGTFKAEAEALRNKLAVLEQETLLLRSQRRSTPSPSLLSELENDSSDDIPKDVPDECSLNTKHLQNLLRSKDLSVRGKRDVLQHRVNKYFTKDEQNDYLSKCPPNQLSASPVTSPVPASDPAESHSTDPIKVLSPEKFYAVKVGRRPGIFNSWEEAEVQVSGFSGAKHRLFKTFNDAKTSMDAPTLRSDSK
jgi:RNA recognition motif-containing protein